MPGTTDAKCFSPGPWRSDYLRSETKRSTRSRIRLIWQCYRRAMRKELVAYLRRPDRSLIRLHDSGTTIGRDPANDVTLEEDKLVSRSHAEIILRSAQWYLVDLGSRNGTIVNGRPTHHHPLRDGDVIGIGSARFDFVLESDPHDTEVAAVISRHEWVNLSERERDVLRLISEGLTDKIIAERLL